MQEKSGATLEHTFSESLVVGDKASLKTDSKQMLNIS
jgi:hypothetical protein